MTNLAKPLLVLTDVHMKVGAYHILHGVDFVVPRGQLTMLLGRNGAGKTSSLRTIMGLWRASQGRIEWDGQDLSQWATPRIADLGVAYVPENMGIFGDLSVKENLLLAARSARRASDMDTARLEWIFSLFPALKTFWNQRAGTLSGGQKQMLALARAVVEPRQLLIVDEPSKGLAPAIVDRMIEAFAQLKASGVTLLVVEQNLHFAQSLGDTVAVMDNGRVVFSGSMQSLGADPDLQRSLLGLAL